MNKLFYRLAITVLSMWYLCIQAMAGSFTAGKGTFLLNGEPSIIKAAELHYPRIPRPYWDQRIKMCKDFGINSVFLFVFCNSHE